METEEVGQTDKGEERNPPRKPAIFGTLADLYQRHRTAKSKKKKEYTFHQENERTLASWSRRVGWFTAVLAATSIFGNWVVWRQLSEMRSSSDDTKQLVKAAQDSAKAAQAALELARERSQQELRAYLSIGKPKLLMENNIMKLTFMIRNAGQTPASEISADLKFKIIETSISGITIHNMKPDNNVWSPIAFIGKEGEIELFALCDFSVSGDGILATLNGGNSYVSIWAAIGYQDVFRKVHHINAHLVAERTRDGKWDLKVGEGGETEED